MECTFARNEKFGSKYMKEAKNISIFPATAGNSSICDNSEWGSVTCFQSDFCAEDILAPIKLDDHHEDQILKSSKICMSLEYDNSIVNFGMVSYVLSKSPAMYRCVRQDLLEFRQIVAQK